MYPTKITNTINPTSWLFKVSILSQKETDSNTPSRLEIIFPLDRCASIFVLRKPTYTVASQIFNFCNQDHQDTSKTLTIEIQAEVPIKQYISVSCFSSIETKSRAFIIPLAVADNEYNLLGRLFFERYSQNTNIRGFTVNFKHSSGD